MTTKFDVKRVKLTGDEMILNCLKNVFNDTKRDLLGSYNNYKERKEDNLAKESYRKFKLAEKLDFTNFLNYEEHGAFLFGGERDYWQKICSRNGWQDFLIKPLDKKDILS